MGANQHSELAATIREELEYAGSWAPPDHEADPEALAALDNLVEQLDIWQSVAKKHADERARLVGQLEAVTKERDELIERQGGTL